jgi:hypothetical protein
MDGLQNSEEGSQKNTIAIHLSIGSFNQDKYESRHSNFLGTYDEIDHVLLNVYQLIDLQKVYFLTDYPLTNSGGTWQVSSIEVPINVTLNFAISAFNSASSEIFSGTTQTSLSSGSNAISIDVIPVSDGVTNVLPIITRIEVPNQFIRSSVDTFVKFFFKANANETLNYSITNQSDGSFLPDNSDITTSGSAIATLDSYYQTPTGAGTYQHRIKLTNSQGNWIRVGFPTNVIDPGSTTDTGFTARINPVVTALGGERVDDTLIWSATVDDDGPLAALTFAWSYEGTGGLTFANSTVNPVTMLNYSTGATGTITLTTTDGNGGTTEIGYQLAADQFPVILSKTLQYALPDTGQTESFTDVVGEDADYDLNPLGYTDNGNGIITDNNTLLMWEQTDVESRDPWSTADTYCNNLGLGAYNDWRLPSIYELKDLVYLKGSTPLMNTDYFIDVETGYHWSSSDGSDSLLARVTRFSDGIIAEKNKTTLNYRYRCVRGTNLITGAFIDNGDLTVTDSISNLMWQQSEGGTYNWEDAITYCENLSLASHDDWRLPNTKELYTLVQTTQSPAIDTIFFPDTAADRYWTSTGYSATNSMYIYFTNGIMDDRAKTRSHYVRCVRNR